MADRATLDWYRQNAPRFTASGAQAPSRDLDSFLDRLQPGARIMELGCGTGRDAARMLERGFDVDATDGVAAMVRKARERFGVEARQMRFDELDVANAYDAVWAHASLLHVCRADLPTILAAIRTALTPGGWHFASFKLGNGEGRDLLGRLHNFPDARWIARRYSEAGLTIVHQRRWPGEAVDGTQRDWIALTARKLG